ncbi:hypothetical protein BGW36DRAFT_432093 [Talaromyces proteolyticus]|uniref:ABM domain-containing protein n=1 Tax=Talaromyces proteolyticus TaxID=1131652 RepID=A0AAD4KG55_9EURO|nr:uncharacterized protein BGW36DRAFT_432093 [Talaromyces proteolyticus]KAH8691543.1 hypothetical protein BGW36DRAFT_432093 [Talaromyces proteolyticus]
MSGDPANGVLVLRPLTGKKDELDKFLAKNLRDIRNVPGVVIAYHFWVEEKGQFIVIESFESTEAMFKYGNSEYHERMVSDIVKLVETPMEAFSDQGSTEELQGFRRTAQAAHIGV